MGSPEDNMLEKEINSWKGFEYALALNRMLTECLENEEYAAALKTKRTTEFCRVIVYGLNFPTTEDDQQVNRKNTEQSKEEKVKVSLLSDGKMIS
jgi:hypothetical protein